jgi:hypothetical protein
MAPIEIGPKLQSLEVSSNNNHKRIPNVPIELVKHKYLFDMGYPYYMRFKYNQLAVTSDLGILIFTI